MSTELFPITQSNVDSFININTPIWAKTPTEESTTNNKKYIYLNFSMVRMQISWIVPKLIFAKGIQEKTGYEIIVMVWKSDEKLRKFLESFDVKILELDTLIHKDKSSLLKTSLSALKLYITGGRGTSLRNTKYKDYPVGMYLYEDIIRTSNLSTIHNCWNKIVFRKYIHIMWTLRSLNKYIKKYPAHIGLFDDLAYHEAMFIQLFAQHKAKTVAISNWAYENIQFEDNNSIKRRMPLLNEELQHRIKNVDDSIISEVDAYLEERFKGNNGRSIDRVAFANKKVLSREELISKFNIDKNKKNIVIMAHTFTDAIFNYGNYYFRDYYDWLDKTLGIAENIKGVNWILKPHPTREAYNESEDSIEDMFQRHFNNIIKNNSNNLYFLPDEISSESIKNIADAIITIGGNAGGEYACFGIPSVIVGKPWYAGFGFTFQPKTYDEYVDTLSKISIIQHLSDEQTKLAKKVFYLKNVNTSYDKYAFRDETAELFNKPYRTMVNEIANSYFKSDEKTSDYNDKMLVTLTEYEKNHDLRDSEYYKTGFSME